MFETLGRHFESKVRVGAGQGGEACALPTPTAPFPLVPHVTPPRTRPASRTFVTRKDTWASSDVEAVGEDFYLAEMEGWQSG